MTSKDFNACAWHIMQRTRSDNRLFEVTGKGAVVEEERCLGDYGVLDKL